jgi:triosephosphate isomerase (TIM)
MRNLFMGLPLGEMRLEFTVKFIGMARGRLVAGNWKMHGSRASIAALLDALVQEKPAGCAVCVPFPYLEQVSQRLRGSPIAWGAQNVSEHAQGAYTGETSAAMLAEFGCRYVIVGHSERRQLYGESDAQAAAKFAAVKKAGMTPILCVGETLQERDAGKTEDVVARQLGAVDFKDGVLAYEPVWAIGTGRTATPEQAQAVHAFLRKKVPAQTPILYGGSVKPQNAAAIFAMPDVDGGLIGGASLVAKDFLDIVRAAGT